MSTDRFLPPDLGRLERIRSWTRRSCQLCGQSFVGFKTSNFCRCCAQRVVRSAETIEEDRKALRQIRRG